MLPFWLSASFPPSWFLFSLTNPGWLYIYLLLDQTWLFIHRRDVIDWFLIMGCVGLSPTEVFVRGARAPGGLGSQWVRHPVGNHHTERDPKRSGFKPSATLQLPRAQILRRRHHTLQTNRPGPTWAQIGEWSCRLSVCMSFCWETWSQFFKGRIFWLNLKQITQSLKCCKMGKCWLLVLQYTLFVVHRTMHFFSGNAPCQGLQLKLSSDQSTA